MLASIQEQDNNISVYYLFGGFLKMSKAQSLSELVTSKEKLGTRNELTSLEVQIRALEIARGLTNTIEPHDMTEWYCRAYRLLGEGRYTLAAQMARKGRTPKNLFSWILKQEMDKKGVV
jgi:hypothetical protein